MAQMGIEPTINGLFCIINQLGGSLIFDVSLA